MASGEGAGLEIAEGKGCVHLAVGHGEGEGESNGRRGEYAILMAAEGDMRLLRYVPEPGKAQKTAWKVSGRVAL